VNEQSHAFRTGLFLIATFALAMVVILGAGNASWLWQPQDHHVAVFNPGADLQGLSPKSDVRVMGVKVGRVKKVEVVESEPGKFAAHVSFALPRDYKFRTGAALKVQTGLTGESVLNVHSLGTGDPIPLGQPIPASTYGLDALMGDAKDVLPTIRDSLAKLGEASATLKTTGDNANKLITRVEGEVDNLVNRYNKVTDTATEALTHARDILRDGKADIKQAFDNVKTVTATTKTRVDTLFDALDKLTGKADTLLANANSILPKITTDVLPRVSKVLDHADKSLDHVDTILIDSKAITANVRTLIAENKANIDAALVAVRRGAEDLRAGIAEIRAAPWRLFNKPSQNEQDNLKVLDATRRYAQAAQDLNNAASVLRDAATNPHVEPARLKDLQDELLREAAKFDKIQKEMWDLYKPASEPKK